MVNPDFSKLLKEKQSRYALVTAVAKRARAISEDKEISKFIGTTKPVSYALGEFMSGEMEIYDPNIDEEAAVEMQAEETAQEDAPVQEEAPVIEE